MTIKGRKQPHRVWSKTVSLSTIGQGNGAMVARPSTCREALKVTADPFHQMLIKHVMEEGEIKRR